MKKPLLNQQRIKLFEVFSSIILEDATLSATKYKPKEVIYHDNRLNFFKSIIKDIPMQKDYKNLSSEEIIYYTYSKTYKNVLGGRVSTRVITMAQKNFITKETDKCLYINSSRIRKEDILCFGTLEF